MKTLSFRVGVIAEVLISLLIVGLFVNCSLILVSQVSNVHFSGVVYAAPGIAIANAVVSADGVNGSGTAITDSGGHYSINEGLPTGTYNVTAFAIGYLMANVTNVHVTVGLTTSGINLYLNRSGGIVGKVTDAVTTLPVAGVSIFAVSSGGTFGWIATTDSNGDYNITTNLGTGTYNVTANNPTGHITKTISGVSVTAGTLTTGVNLALNKSGIISGRITAYPSGSPLGNASVTAISGQYIGSATTNATGYYRITTGLGTDTYTMYASYGLTGFNVTSGVVVTAGLETSNVDMFIIVIAPPPSGIITGKVTDMSSSDPIEGAFVEATGLGGFGFATTDSNGDYVISSGLDTGTYDVTASATGYNDTTITGVNVIVNQTTPNVNIQLTKIPSEQSGSIEGDITGDSNPVPEFASPALLFLTTVAATIALVFVKKRTIQKTR
jgi:hypothetical protein